MVIVAAACLHSTICAVVLVPLLLCQAELSQSCSVGQLPVSLPLPCWSSAQSPVLGLQGYLAVSDLPLVSMDFKKSDVSTTIDSSLTMVMGDDMVKVGHTHTHTHMSLAIISTVSRMSSSTCQLPDCLLLLTCCCDYILSVLSHIANITMCLRHGTD